MLERKEGLKAEEIARELMKMPEAPVWCGAWNGHVSTYAMVDQVYRFEYDQISNDFFGTPGRFDRRLLKQPSTSDIFYIGTLFGVVPNSEVDMGNDDIDYPIETINGEDGDPYLVWKLNNFNSYDGGKTWEREGTGWKIMYDAIQKTLDANNFRESRRFIGKVEGIETLRNIITILKIDLDIWT